MNGYPFLPLLLRINCDFVFLEYTFQKMPKLNVPTSNEEIKYLTVSGKSLGYSDIPLLRPFFFLSYIPFDAFFKHIRVRSVT